MLTLEANHPICTDLLSFVDANSSSLRPICCEVLWLINCWTILFLFVVCIDSFVESTWVSLLVLEAKLGCHMYWALGSQRSCFDGLFCVLLWVVLLGAIT